MKNLMFCFMLFLLVCCTSKRSQHIDENKVVVAEDTMGLDSAPLT